MVDVQKLFEPSVEFENDDMTLSEETKARASKPVENHRTVPDVGSCLTANGDAALKANRASRKNAFMMFTS
jgi:hypothetical protein